jgi:hypothetical protein
MLSFTNNKGVPVTLNYEMVKFFPYFKFTLYGDDLDWQLYSFSADKIGTYLIIYLIIWTGFYIYLII